MDPIAHFQGYRTCTLLWVRLWHSGKALTLSEQNKKLSFWKTARLQTSAHFRLQLQFHLAYLWTIFTSQVFLQPWKRAEWLLKASSLPLWRVIWLHSTSYSDMLEFMLLAISYPCFKHVKIQDPITLQGSKTQDSPLCVAAIWSTSLRRADGFILCRRCSDGVSE